MPTHPSLLPDLVGLLRTLVFSGFFVVACAVSMLLLGIFFDRFIPGRYWIRLLFLVLVACLITLLWDGGYSFTGVAPPVLGLSRFLAVTPLFRFFGLLTVCLYIGAAAATLREETEEEEKNLPERLFLILLSFFGGWMVIFSRHLLPAYLGLEIQSLCFYVLVAMDSKDRLQASEAGVKYFILSSLSSCFLLFGIAMYYASAQTFEIEFVPVRGHGILLAGVFVLSAVAFKISAAPFHMWTPDVFQGAPTFAAALLSLGSKSVALALLIKLAIVSFSSVADYWQPTFQIIGFVSVLWGSLGAIRQSDFKRLIGYSSISQVGFMLIGLGSASSLSVPSAVAYFTLYGVALLGLWACFSSMKHRGQPVTSLDDMSCLAHRNPLFATLMTLFLLSMAGIPPFSGFFAKFFVLEALLDSHAYKTAVLAAVMAALAAVYYLRVVRVLYFDEPKLGTVTVDVGPAVLSVLVLTASLTFFFFLCPDLLLVLVRGNVWLLR